jgi:WhiB family redox-sensing transcriptional regulator
MAVVMLETKKGSLPTEVSKLPFSVFNYDDWSEKALCLGVKISFFFASSNTNHAKNICSLCPVKNECLIWALIYKEEGIWGGTTDRERKSFSTDYVDALVARAKYLDCYSPEDAQKLVKKMILGLYIAKAG